MNALSIGSQDALLPGLLPASQKVAGPAADRESGTTEFQPETLDASHFPVSIRHVAGRGRGFFATRDIQLGETVFSAVPLAWAISEDWMKNTCWWCFAYSPRRGHPIKAMDVDTTSSKSPRSFSNRYKGVFCSLECRQIAITAHGGQEKWGSYLALLAGMEDEIQQHGSRKPSSSKAHTGPGLCSSTIGLESTLSESEVKRLVCHDVDADFDPDDLTDDQLGEWMSAVWDDIADHGLFSDYMPDSSERELTRLVANQLCLCDALSPDQGSETSASDWQTEMVAKSAAGRDVAPLDALFHVKSNETEVFRASIRQMQLVPTSLDGSGSVPATIAPIRLPWHPTPSLILQSNWGSSFQAAGGSYSLLSRAWKRATKSHKLGVLDHAGFRGVYYREKANSFGIWDPPTDVLQPAASEASGLGVSYDEREWVGFSIYPTAVYFNHSCAPNVSKTRHGRTMSYVSNRKVQSGEELFISYGSTTDVVSERRGRLCDHFFFECACERCIAESSVQLLALDE
ncbi:hypothetical protein GGI06_002945 [Coemansia sp. S85]|nr:hypothetical protein GGI06_002945 [Coemansia sp. S85]